MVGNRESGAYSATKFALIAYSEALEYDLRDSGIGVSVAVPGASLVPAVPGLPSLLSEPAPSSPAFAVLRDASHDLG